MKKIISFTLLLSLIINPLAFAQENFYSSRDTKILKHIEKKYEKLKTIKEILETYKEINKANAEEVKKLKVQWGIGHILLTTSAVFSAAKRYFYLWMGSMITMLGSAAYFNIEASKLKQLPILALEAEYSDIVEELKDLFGAYGIESNTDDIEGLGIAIEELSLLISDRA